jgi:hypothetical protein
MESRLQLTQFSRSFLDDNKSQDQALHSNVTESFSVVSLGSSKLDCTAFDPLRASGVLPKNSRCLASAASISSVRDIRGIAYTLIILTAGWILL